MARALDLRLELGGVSTVVWRTLRVPADLHLDDLHHAIQTLMGWDDRHLHVFEVAGREYGSRPGDEEELVTDTWAGDGRSVTIADVIATSGGAIDYVYDFGDEWRLHVSLIREATASAANPIECLGGEGANPPEDSGGPGAYQGAGSPFDVAAANVRLRRALGPAASPEFPAGRTAPPEEQLLARVSLAMLFLGSRETRHGQHEAPKTVRQDILDALVDAGLIYTDAHRKSVVITAAGVQQATALLDRLQPRTPL